MDIIETTFAPAGQLLSQLADNTGLKWGIVPRKDFWHRSPAFHCFEAAFFLPLAVLSGALFFFPWVNKMKLMLPVAPKPPVFRDMVLGTVLALCFLSQIVFKAMRPNAPVQLLWLLMPCHVLTAAWAAVLLQKPGSFNFAECRIAAAFLALSGWGAALGLATPDWSDHRMKIEGVIFYVHHIALLGTPTYWAATHGQLPLSAQLVAANTFIMFFGNYFVYTPIAYLTGNNVNYNLFPPKIVGTLCEKWFGHRSLEQWYRFVVPILLAIAGLLHWALMTAVATSWRRFRAARLKLQREQKARQGDENAASAGSSMSAPPASVSRHVGSVKRRKAAPGAPPVDAKQKETSFNTDDSVAAVDDGNDEAVAGADGYVNPGGFIKLPKGGNGEQHQQPAQHLPVPKGSRKAKKEE